MSETTQAQGGATQGVQPVAWLVTRGPGDQMQRLAATFVEKTAEDYRAHGYGVEPLVPLSALRAAEERERQMGERIATLEGQVRLGETALRLVERLNDARLDGKIKVSLSHAVALRGIVAARRAVDAGCAVPAVGALFGTPQGAQQGERDGVEVLARLDVHAVDFLDGLIHVDPAQLPKVGMGDFILYCHDPDLIGSFVHVRDAATPTTPEAHDVR